MGVRMASSPIEAAAKGRTFDWGFDRIRQEWGRAIPIARPPP
jgi:hypothetical protein